MGIDENLKDEKGRTAKDLAVDCGNFGETFLKYPINFWNISKLFET